MLSQPLWPTLGSPPPWASGKDASSISAVGTPRFALSWSAVVIAAKVLGRPAMAGVKYWCLSRLTAAHSRASSSVGRCTL